MRKRQLSGSIEEPDSKIKKIKDEEKLVICKSPISLQDMAASQVSVLLWYHQNIRLLHHFQGIICHNSHNEPYTHLSKKGYNYEYYDCDDYLIKQISLSVEKLPVPPRAQNIIKNHLKPVDRQLKHWLYYHNKRIFFNRKVSNKANEVADEIIWRSNGTIDYLASARNMLKSNRLDNLEKARFMFTYCLEDEIKNIPPCKDIFLDDMNFEEHPLIFYWSQYLRNKASKIPIGASPLIESRMLTEKNVDNWSAIQYFFDRLDFEEQIEKCVFLIREYGIRYQSELLSKLSDSQQHRVFMDCAKLIIINFGEIASYKRSALEVWIRCGRIITELEFAEIIEELINFSYQFYAGDTEHIPSLLTDLWKNASEDYRTFALNHKEHKIIDIIIFYEHFLNVDRLELLIELLSNADRSILRSIAESKLFFYFCQALLQKFPAYYLDKLINVCVVEQTSEFKKRLLEYEDTTKHFVTLVREGNIERLTCLLLVLVPYTEVNKFKKRFLSSLSIMNFFISEIRENRCNELRELIDKYYPEQREAADCKEMIILERRTVDIFCRKLYDGEFNAVKTSVENLLASMKDFQLVKKKLLSECKTMMMQLSIPYSWGAEWDEFSTWCSGGESVAAN